MPVLDIISTSKGSKIAFWDLAETVSELEKRYQIKPSEAEKYNHITSEKRQKEFLATRLLLTSTLGANYEIDYQKSGKPFIANSPIKISITHSKNIVAIIISDIYEVAIDLEFHTPRIERIMSKFMNESEVNFIRKQKERGASTLIWCAKETLFKLINKEEVDFKKDFHIRPFNPQKKGIIASLINTITPPVKQEINYFVNSDYALTYCED